MKHLHPIDALEARRLEIISSLREAIVASAIPRHTLAVQCGLSDRALKAFDDPAWNPSLRTIRKVCVYLDARAKDRNDIRQDVQPRKVAGRAQRPDGAVS